MCGRFALFTPPARLARYFGASLAEGVDPEFHSNWNVAPTDQVLGVRDRPAPPGTGEEPQRMLMSFRWGLIPWWSKDAKSGSRLFNARSETVATKASFREAFRERRIIVPADGFYEWDKTKPGAKQPHYFSRADGVPLAFAGLAERWRAKGAPKDAPVRPELHRHHGARRRGHGGHPRPHAGDPRPRPPSTSGSTRPTRTPKSCGRLLHPPPAGTVVHHPVGPRIGNVANNDPTLIEAV